MSLNAAISVGCIWAAVVGVAALSPGAATGAAACAATLATLFVAVSDDRS